MGLWDSPIAYRQGEHLDEGFFEAEPITRATPRASSSGPVRLEVFQQLGLLYWKKFAPGEEYQPGEDKFQGSNYVLVTNVYDDSIWVLWNSRPMNQHTGRREPAKDRPQLQANYAIFPGTEGPMAFTVIYAKIADSWDKIPGKGSEIFFRQERRLKRGHQNVDEPTLVKVF